MCGICGASIPGPRNVGESVVQAMVAIQRHRGPEDQHVVSSRRVILGQARLCIIDLSGGAQPMRSHDGAYWIAFNGEVFNYLELRAELEAAGHLFRTQSDTEVILEAFRAWGTDCFQRFNGQWAIALWDRRANRLVLCRDRMGIRPLYYTRVGDSMLFASELKALFCHPEVERRLDPYGVSQSFTFWSPIAPHTAFAGVEQLPPGSFVVVNTMDGRATVPERYWSPDFGANDRIRRASLAENAARLREILVDAVRLRFNRSDVPVGLYLSGGLDSTITAAVLAHCTSVPLQTFSVVFSEAEFDESYYQELAADALKTEHHRVFVDATEIAEVFPEVVWHAEQPLLRTAPGPLLLLSRLARQSSFKVVVTGEGADEIFAGYDIFREAAVRRLVAEHPETSDADALLQQLYPWMNRSPAQAPAFARAFFAHDLELDDPVFSHRPRWRASAALLRLLHVDFAAPEWEALVADLSAGLPLSFRSWDPLEQAQHLEMETLLSGYILSAQGDRMLMANSVEGRFPFLDHRVVEFANSLPVLQKLNGLNEKHILKHAFRDLVPDEVLRRPKQPYRAPDAESFLSGDGSRDWFEALLDRRSVEEAGIFNASMVEGLVRKCASRNGHGMSNTDNMRLVAVVSVMLLHSEFVVGRDPFERAMIAGASIPVTSIDEVRSAST